MMVSMAPLVCARRLCSCKVLRITARAAEPVVDRREVRGTSGLIGKAALKGNQRARKIRHGKAPKYVSSPSLLAAPQSERFLLESDSKCHERFHALANLRTRSWILAIEASKSLASLRLHGLLCEAAEPRRHYGDKALPKIFVLCSCVQLITSASKSGRFTLERF